jgi:hypothetical protein
MLLEKLRHGHELLRIALIVPIDGLTDSPIVRGIQHFHIPILGVGLYLVVIKVAGVRDYLLLLLRLRTAFISGANDGLSRVASGIGLNAFAGDEFIWILPALLGIVGVLVWVIGGVTSLVAC